jgi:hypothetical protein
LDTDKALQSFFDSCFKAGPSNCAFYAPSPEAISQNLTRLYDNLKSRPVPVFSRHTGSYGIVDYNFLRLTIFVSLYNPYIWFPVLADALTTLSKGNAEAFWDVASGPQILMKSVGEALIGIACNDGIPIPGTIEDAELHFAELSKTSQWADVWAKNRFSCS